MQAVADSTGAPSAVDVREVQLVSTRADVGTVIARGTFRLSFNYLWVTDQDPQVRSRTPELQYNASAASVQAALEVRRWYGGGSCVGAVG